MGGTALDSKSIQLQALNSIFEKKKSNAFFLMKFLKMD